MRALLLSLLFAATVAAQQQDGRTPAEAARKFKQSIQPTAAAETVHIPAFWGVLEVGWSRVTIQLPQDRGLKEPMFCSVNDLDDSSLEADPRVIELTPQKMVIEAKRGHDISWRVWAR